MKELITTQLIEEYQKELNPFTKSILKQKRFQNQHLLYMDIKSLY
jgi:hypothetical protein